jgi:translation initiation factor 6
VREVLRLIAYDKNPNIGVYVGANDSVAVLPANCPRRFASTVSETLGVRVIETNICGIGLVGVMMALNNHGAVVSKHCTQGELDALRKAGLEVGVIPDKYTALGNLTLLNDRAAVASEVLSKKAVRIMEDALNCEVVLRNLGGYKTTGSLGIATNKGALLHPLLKEEELDWVEEVLRVSVDIGTVNQGVGFVRTGLIANSRGALIGNATTGPEIARIEDSLGFL